MQSISGFLGGLVGGRQTPRPGTPGRADITAGTETAAWAKRQVMDSHAYYAHKNKQPWGDHKYAGPDPRDTPKYGVTGTRPQSTKSKHGTGRGGQV